MRRTSRNRAGGFALIEAAIATMVLLIAITGTIAFNQYSMIDIYKSQTRTDACMLGSVIMECWQGQGGSTSFNPVNNLSASILNCSDMDVRTSWIGPGVPSGFTLVWNLYPYYRITTNSVMYRVALSYRYINGKKFLNVRVSWPSSMGGTFVESNKFVGITECLN